MRNISLIVAVAVLCCCTSVSAESSATSLFQRGNDFYRADDYKKAIEAYQEAQETGARHPALFYNLGNAYLRNGELGRAIANYLRAKRLDPRDRDIRFNLDYAREKIEARLEKIEKGPFTRAFNSVVSKMSANEWTALLMASYWLFCIAATVWIVADGPLLGKAGKISFICLLILFVLLTPFAGVRVKRDFYTPRAVVVTDKVTGRSGPGKDNTEIIDLYEGMDVKLSGCQQEWCRVRGGNGFVVWVPASSLLRI